MLGGKVGIPSGARPEGPGRSLASPFLLEILTKIACWKYNQTLHVMTQRHSKEILQENAANRTLVRYCGVFEAAPKEHNKKVTQKEPKNQNFDFAASPDLLTLVHVWSTVTNVKFISSNLVYSCFALPPEDLTKFSDVM